MKIWAAGHSTKGIGAFISLAWTVLARARMGDSWRSGIDEEHRAALFAFTFESVALRRAA